MFDPAGFIIPDGRIVCIQFHFDLFVLVYLPYLFSIANLDDWLTVHRSITLVDLQFDAQNFCDDTRGYIYIYIYTHLRRRPPEDEQGNTRNT